MLTDGFPVRGLAVPALAMWKGDRGRRLRRGGVGGRQGDQGPDHDGYGRAVPGYGFAAHKGYSTRAHMRALAVHGPCPEHRMSFANVNGRGGAQAAAAAGCDPDAG